jgi:hypothetical protein
VWLKHCLPPFMHAKTIPIRSADIERWQFIRFYLLLRFGFREGVDFLG